MKKYIIMTIEILKSLIGLKNKSYNI